ncbi:MAG: transcription antitermination factor NusB [Verrucomicrobia bacterium]|nr:transcription antitermination factor NusB [Verrucomicrobiota bacterium]
MALSPQKFREIVFQLIYSDDFGGEHGGDAEIVEMLMAQLAVTKRIVREACAFKEKFLEKKKEIDEIIVKHSESYDFERIPRIERNVIRLGLYELLFSADIPPKVAIAEAIRLTRKFATPEAATFVNAILDSVFKQIAKEEPHVPTLSGLSV